MDLSKAKGMVEEVMTTRCKCSTWMKLIENQAKSLKAKVQ
jgi:hypothetical protein